MSEQLDPQKYHVLTKTQKKLLFIILALFLLVSVPPLAYLYYNFAVNRPTQTAKELTFKIKGGDSLFEIAQNLYDEEVLNSKVLFTFYALVSGKDKNIQAGTYKIPAGTSVKGLVELFQHGTDDVQITFLEGWRIEEYALAAAEHLDNVDYEDFMALAQDYEGYLFPDTYKFNIDVTEESVIDILRQTFETKTETVLSKETLAAAGIDRGEAVILASIVEREVSNETDRPVVAGILIKRWREGKTLGADATTQYVAALNRVGCLDEAARICPSDNIALEVEWWPKSLTASELDLDNPYNTRKVVGLPPTPICNPSISALEAVLGAVTTDYEYYLTDSNGVTHYARTLDEHVANIQRYL